MSGTLEKTIIAPSEATGLVEGAYQAMTSQLPMAKLLPDESNKGELMVSWTPNTEVEQDEAPFTEWDVEAQYGRTQGSLETRNVKVLPLRKRMRVTERDLIRLGSNQNALREALAGHFDSLGKDVAWRLERARLEALLNGKLTIPEVSKSAEWDYGRDSKLTASASKKWSDVAANPVDDILAWADLIKKAKGLKPTTVFTSSDVLLALGKNTSIISLAFGRGDQLPTRVGQSVVLDVLKEYAKISSVVIADEAYEAVETQYGLSNPNPWPSDAFLLVPQAQGNILGETAMGPTVEAGDSEYSIGKSDNSGLIGAVFSTTAPPAYEAYTNGSALPVLEKSNSTLKASVL